MPSEDGGTPLPPRPILDDGATPNEGDGVLCCGVAYGGGANGDGGGATLLPFPGFARPPPPPVLTKPAPPAPGLPLLFVWTPVAGVAVWGIIPLFPPFGAAALFVPGSGGGAPEEAGGAPEGRPIMGPPLAPSPFVPEEGEAKYPGGGGSPPCTPLGIGPTSAPGDGEGYGMGAPPGGGIEDGIGAPAKSMGGASTVGIIPDPFATLGAHIRGAE